VNGGAYTPGFGSTVAIEVVPTTGGDDVLIEASVRPQILSIERKRYRRLGVIRETKLEWKPYPPKK
jgi:hypothetical protein